MSVCPECKMEMGEVDDCTANHTIHFLDGTVMEAVPYGKGPNEEFKRCPDCGVAVGKFHHPGCEMEICPRCDKRSVGACLCFSTTDN